MENLFDKFMEEIEDFMKATGLNECEICNDAFDEHAMCECVHEGSEDYFDTSMEQWYPGDSAEYKVTGYNTYLSTIVQTVADAFADHYGVYKSTELVGLMYENINEIFQNALLDEDAFEEKAIERYENR